MRQRYNETHGQSDNDKQRQRDNKTQPQRDKWTVLLANRVRANDERDSYFIKHQGFLELFDHVGDRGGRGQ